MEEDDMRAWFPCTFCYVDIQVSPVCLHLQNEHCFDLKNAVCPICAANLGKDAIGHFTTQHAHRTRKSQKSSSRSNNSTVPGKDMRELYSYRGLQSSNGKSDMHENAPDPLLSPFLCSTPLPNLESNADALTSCISAFTTSEATTTSSKSGMLDEAQKQDYAEEKQQAAFVQQLILSTIF